MFSLALVAFALGCSDELSVPRSVMGACVPTLQKRASGRAPCIGDAVCAQILREPERQVGFTVSFRGSLSGSTVQQELTDEERVHRRICLMEYLRGQGVDTFSGEGSIAVLHTRASYSQVKGLFEMALVDRLEPGCPSAGDCPECASRPAASCTEDAFCSAITGNQVDAVRSCKRPVQPVGCHPHGTLCGTAFTFARDSAGECWQFPLNCLPPSFRRAEGADCRPPSGSTHPDCPAP